MNYKCRKCLTKQDLSWRCVACNEYDPFKIKRVIDYAWRFQKPYIPSVSQEFSGVLFFSLFAAPFLAMLIFWILIDLGDLSTYFSNYLKMNIEWYVVYIAASLLIFIPIFFPFYKSLRLERKVKTLRFSNSFAEFLEGFDHDDQNHKSAIEEIDWSKLILLHRYTLLNSLLEMTEEVISDYKIRDYLVDEIKFKEFVKKEIKGINQNAEKYIDYILKFHNHHKASKFWSEAKSSSKLAEFVSK